MNSHPILSRKISVPPPIPTMMSRPRLWEQMNQKTYKLITVIAPAGYGKSVFLTDWARHSGNQACWFSLHTSDNDMIVFIRYLIDSIRTLFPGFGPSLHKLLHTTQPSIESILALLIQQISDIGEPFCLILDDYHFIENAEIHDKLSYLLQYLPENMTLIVSSRTSMPYPLARIRLEGELLEIGERELSFTLKETSLLVKTGPIELDDEQTKQVFVQTEGWAAGIQLVMLSYKHSEFQRTDSPLDSSTQHVHTYLFEEVFLDLPEDVREFLLATSCLDQLNESLCNEVADRQNSRHILTYLVQNNLFLIALDHEKNTFRYHHLFSEFLRNYLSLHQPENLPTYHSRASRWYEARHMIQEAMEHESAAGNDIRVCSLLVKMSPTMLKQGQADQLIHRIQMLDANHVQSTPELLIYYCWALVLRMRIEETNEIIDELEQQFMQQLDENGKHPLIPELSLLKSHACFLQHDFKGLLEYRQKTSVYLPYESEILKNVEFNPNHPFLLRSTLGYFGDFTATGNILSQMMSYMANKEQAQKEVQLEPSVWGFISGMNGEFYVEKNEMTKAEPFLLEAMHIGKETNMLGIYFPATITFLQMKKFSDPNYEMEPMLRDLAQFIIECDMPQWQLALESFQVHMDLWQGRTESVDTWLERSKLPTDGQLTLQREYDYLTLCRVWITQNLLPQAIAMLDRLSIIAIQEQRYGTMIELSIIKSIALYKQMHPIESRNTLLAALRLGMEKGYFMTFVYEGNFLLPILSEIVQSGQDPFLNSFIQGIQMQILQHSEGRSLSTKELSELLTKREYELLTRMADGLTNKEIAHQMKLSLGTVKVYSNRIYKKLQVSNRIQATQLMNKRH